jgi:hypothetical protein
MRCEYLNSTNKKLTNKFPLAWNFKVTYADLCVAFTGYDMGNVSKSIEWCKSMTDGITNLREENSYLSMIIQDTGFFCTLMPTGKMNW